MRKKGFDFEMNDESMMHKPLITKLGYAGFHALNWSWLFNKYLSLKMVILSSLPLNYSGFFWLHRFLHRHAYFAPCLTLYFLIYCSFPSSRYSFSAIKVSSKSWLSQKCFSDITNGNYCLSPSPSIYGFVCVFLAAIYHLRLHALCVLQIFRIKIREKHANYSCTKFVTSAARNDHHLSYDDDLPQEPFLLTLIKDVIWYLQNFNLSSNCISVMRH